MRSKSIFIFLVMIFLASCAAPTATQTSEVSETSEVLIPTPTSTLAPVTRIVVTPGAPIVELPSSAEIDSSNAALPEWIIGNFEAIGLSDGLKPTAWDSASYASVRRHGLVPVLEGGVVANYRDSNGLVYAPVLAQISSEDGTVLSPVGGVQPGGIMEYSSADGAVKRYVRVGIACPEESDCLPAVRYIGEDAGGFYWLMLDKNTGEITAYSPAVTEDEPGRAEWLPVGDRWSSALSGPTALQAGEGYGIDYRQSVDGTTNIFYFAAGDSQYQAKDREIHYTPTDKRLWVENESGIFLFDNTTHEWTRVADQGTQLIGVGDEQMIIADESWHTVESIDDSSGVQIVTTQDGQKWVWGQDGWNKEKTQVEYWLNEDGTTKPGEVVPAGCLEVDGEDTCILRAEASPQVYEGLLKVIYNIAVSFGQNPGGFYQKSGDYFKDKQAVAEGAEEFVRACMAGQVFGDLINIDNFPLSPEDSRISEEHQVVALPAMVYAVPFDATIDCRNIGLKLVTNEEMEAMWDKDMLEGWWSTQGDMWWGRFEAVPLNDGSGRSRIVMSLGRLEDSSEDVGYFKLKPGGTSESVFVNLGLYQLITALDPVHGTLSIQSPRGKRTSRYVSLLEQGANVDDKNMSARGVEALQKYFDTYWGGGIAESK